MVTPNINVCLFLAGVNQHWARRHFDSQTSALLATWDLTLSAPSLSATSLRAPWRNAVVITPRPENGWCANIRLLWDPEMHGFRSHATADGPYELQ